MKEETSLLNETARIADAVRELNPLMDCIYTVTGDTLRERGKPEWR